MNQISKARSSLQCITLTKKERNSDAVLRVNWREVTYFGWENNHRTDNCLVLKNMNGFKTQIAQQIHSKWLMGNLNTLWHWLVYDRLFNDTPRCFYFSSQYLLWKKKISIFYWLALWDPIGILTFNPYVNPRLPLLSMTHFIILCCSYSFI